MSVEAMGTVLSEESLLKLVGEIAGECYGSSNDLNKCIARAEHTCKRGHHSPWEHVNITLKSVMDRGTSHAVVRHRHCAFQQSSTIYQNYSKDDCITIVELPEVDPTNNGNVQPITLSEHVAYQMIAERYIKGIKEDKMNAARARDLLPNALATTLITTTNIREWMYIIHRRKGPGDAIRMHTWACMVENWFELNYPSILGAFKNYYSEHPL
jgi:thymidylate synthase (FAD)